MAKIESLLTRNQVLESVVLSTIDATGLGAFWESYNSKAKGWSRVERGLVGAVYGAIQLLIPSTYKVGYLPRKYLGSVSPFIASDLLVNGITLTLLAHGKPTEAVAVRALYGYNVSLAGNLLRS